MTRPILSIFLLSIWAFAGPNLATTPPNLERTLAVQQEKVSSDPRDPVAWNDLGNLLVLASRYAEAEEAYLRALDLTPEDLPARFNLALLLQQTGRPRDAESELERLLELDPRHAWGHYQLGVILAGRQDRRGALEHYAQALAYDPSLTFASNNPHIIDNPLFSEALLLSQRYNQTPGARVPRQYGDPDRIVELMLRHQEEAEAGDEADAGEAEDDEEGEATPGGGSSASFDAAPPPGPARVQPDSVANRLRQSTAPQPTGGVTVGTPPARGQSAGQSPDRSATNRRIVSPRSIPPASSAPRAAPRPPAARSEPGASSQDRPELRETPPPPPSRRSSRYIPPSRRSTGQLEFKLLPEEEPPIRVAKVNDSKNGS